ncbi:MAG: hypothetical protein GY898_13790 [Proteobacteria bacterium]|nr:hypothetical protein [Pseudomonadota bacterium]
MGHARLYGASHRETWRAMEQSLGQMGQVLERYGALDLESSQEGLAWGGSMVHPETEEFVGLGRLLHREGIATLSLAQGLDLEELAKLLDVLRINFELPEYEEETLESLLWQSGFTKIGFQAVSALMEAEVLSGAASQTATGNLDDAVQQLVGLRLSDFRTESDKRNFGQVSEDAVQRAVAGSDLAGLGPSDDRRVSEEEQQWRVQFAEEGTEDAHLIANMHEAVEAEEPHDLLARLVSILVRTALSNRSELPPDEAIGLARQAVEEVYRRGNAVGLVRILDEGTALMAEDVVRTSPFAGRVREFFANAISERRIARVLLSLDLAKAGEEHELRRLVERLPDSVLQSVLESAARDPDQARGKRLRETLGSVVGDRIDAWLTNALTQPPERVVPTIALARSLGRERAASSRYKLLRHPSRLVREEVLRWYQDNLPAAELQYVLPLLVDKDAAVRRALADALLAQKPYEAVKYLRKAVGGATFSSLDANIKRDLCITLGLVAGDGAVEVLAQRLESKGVKMMGTAPEVLADVEAAARGLAAAGTVQAKQTLKRGTSGLFGPKKKICTDALQRLEARNPW